MVLKTLKRQSGLRMALRDEAVKRVNELIDLALKGVTLERKFLCLDGITTELRAQRKIN